MLGLLRLSSPSAALCSPSLAHFNTALTATCAQFSTAAKASAAKAPRPVAKIPVSLPADLLPRSVNGKWYQPRLSARKAAELRKQAVTNGKVFVGASAPGEWDPEWDRVRQPRIMKAPKGIAHDRAQQGRIDKITKLLADQPRIQEDYKKTLPPKVRRVGLSSFLRKEKWEK